MAGARWRWPGPGGMIRTSGNARRAWGSRQRGLPCRRVERHARQLQTAINAVVPGGALHQLAHASRSVSDIACRTIAIPPVQLRDASPVAGEVLEAPAHRDLVEPRLGTAGV